jgi:Family of unknown function (DUF6941)
VRIDWAIPCRYVEVGDTGTTIVGGGADIFFVQSVPTEIGLWLAVRIAGPPHELRPDHAFEQSVLSPGRMQAVSTLGFTLPMGPTPLKPEGSEGSHIFPTFTRFPASEGGNYSIDLSVDDRHTTIPIYVVTPEMLPQPEDEE